MNASMEWLRNSNKAEYEPLEDFITIIAPTLSEVMDSFRSQGLAEKDYTILHRAGPHSFTFAGQGQKTTPLFEGMQMVAATFVRRVQA